MGGQARRMVFTGAHAYITIAGTTIDTSPIAVSHLPRQLRVWQPTTATLGSPGESVTFRRLLANVAVDLASAPGRVNHNGDIDILEWLPTNESTPFRNA